MIDRRQFLKLSSSLLLTAPFAGLTAQNLFAPPILKPPRLRKGDTMGLVNPAGVIFTQEEVDLATAKMEELGLAVKAGQHVLDRYGYLAGQDADRARDLMNMFTDPDIHGILALRGGWGCNRILPLLNFKTIRRNP